MKTIFVSIASYRDPDVQNTINNLFEMAEHADRIRVGVFLQIADEDIDCNVTNRSGVTVRSIHAKDAKGAGYARSKIQELVQDEDFFFQIDSHMRFVEHWDRKLIQMYEQCPSEKSIISTYPLPFTSPNQLHPDRLVKINPKKFDVDGVLLQSSGMYPIDNDTKLQQTAFIAAGMFFSTVNAIREVPADPHIVFTGEEITTAVRLWTHGYNTYIPSQVIAYHNYEVNPARPRIWHDEEVAIKRNAISRSRVLYLCGQRSTVPSDCLIDIDQYGLGMQRSMTAFEDFSELDFKNKTYKGKELI